jgi:hypothetical protein
LWDEKLKWMLQKDPIFPETGKSVVAVARPVKCFKANN